MSVRQVSLPRSDGRRAVKVMEAHEGIGLRVGCNTPACRYGPSQDEKPWGRGLRAQLDCDDGVFGCHATSRKRLTDLRIESLFFGTSLLPVYRRPAGPSGMTTSSTKHQELEHVSGSPEDDSCSTKSCSTREDASLRLAEVRPRTSPDEMLQLPNGEGRR
jgi:hypothetical protein